MSEELNINNIKEVWKQRLKEIEVGENRFTCKPMYVVLKLEEQIALNCEEISGITNFKEKRPQEGWYDDADEEEREIKECSCGMKKPQQVMRFWIDRPVAFFLTRKGAEEYLEYQKHNLEDAYIYVFSCGYRNKEFDFITEEIKTT
jgi:hypothetical protein